MNAPPVICIVEDDDSLRSALMGLVRSFGYRSEGFPSAEAFLERPRSRDCDCIVADIQMPGLSGLGLKARLEELGATTPMIFVTARTEPVWREKARASGAICVLSKPFAEEALISCVRRALGLAPEPD